MVTLKDIAQRVGVDVSAVSKVLQGAPIRISSLKRAEIMRVALEMEYQPNTAARSLRMRRSGAIAIVVPSITNYLYPEIISGAEEEADERRYVLFLLRPLERNPEEQLIGIVQQGRVDGLLFADDSPGAVLLDSLSAHGVPFVCLNRYGPDDRQTVALDDEAGFDTQAGYLFSLGHRKIAFVAVSPRSFVSRLCQKAFLGALARRGVPMPPSRIVTCDFSGDHAEEAADALVRMRPRPTAIAAASAMVAVRLVESLRARGLRVPEDVSVIGYHEAPVALSSRVGVTTVRMPSRLHGRRGVERLMEVIEGATFQSEILNQRPEIVDRGTCTEPTLVPPAGGCDPLNKGLLGEEE